MWPVLAEFRSASSKGSARKQKTKEEERRIAVKPKSVGQPNNKDDRIELAQQGSLLGNDHLYNTVVATQIF